MRRTLAALTVVTVAVTGLLSAQAQAGTAVSGVISSDTTWTRANSPYEVTGTVQIPEGVKLTIEPGVEVFASPGVADMFLVHGVIEAVGTNTERINFDGGGSSNFFSPKSSPGSMFVHVEYANIRNGRSIWPPTGFEQYGHITLRHSHVSDVPYYSYIWYPTQDVFIEYNSFSSSAGFSIGHRDANVYIRWNRFASFDSALSYIDYWLENWAAYDASQTIINFNSFGPVPAGNYALKLPSGYDSAAMDGTNNYWGTTDTALIDPLIYDKNDDITSAGVIPYNPILENEDPNVPALPQPSPSPSPSPSQTLGPSPSPTPTPSPTEPAPSEVERAVGLRLRHHLIAKGRVMVSNSGEACLPTEVALKRKKGKRPWRTIATPAVDPDTGRYKVRIKDRVGRYRAKVGQHRLDDGLTTCLRDKSPIRKHSH